MDSHLRRRLLLSTSALLAVILSAGAAAAQTDPEPASSQQARPDAPASVQTPAATAGPVTVGGEDVTDADIVITGSRIRGAAPVGSSVIAIDRSAIQASGAVTTDRLIKEIPQVFDLGTSENSRGQSGGNSNITFGNAINIRGIGPYATLTILDGHRVVNNSRSVDPSIIPSLGLERVEVVADGASAVYGSDAIAGVVNLIPRRNLNGIETIARMGVARDFHESQFGIAGGKTGDWGQVMVAYEHVFRSNLSGDDRDFFTSDQRRFGGRDFRTTQCNPGTLTVGGVNYAIPAGGVTAANAAALVPNTVNRCEGFTGQDLFPETRYDSVNATFTVHLTDWLDAFGDGYFSNRRFRRNNGYTGATVTVPSTNAFFVRPAGTTDAESVQIRLDELPNNISFGSTRSWQGAGGLRAKFGSWEVQGQIIYGRNDDTSNTPNGINTPALNAALASSNPATAFDPYGLGRTSAAVLAAINDQVFNAPTLNRFTGAEATINGTLFDLPGGGVKLAAGYERQELEVALGIQRGAPSTPLTFRNYARKVDSGYAELFVPIFGTGNAIPGLRRLELSAAVRYDKYSDVGDTTNPKFGINWSPFRGLTVRGSYGTSFRAPLFSQIYGNSSNIFVQPYADPTLGGTIVQGAALSGGNTGLRPEEAKTWSAGADWEPTRNLRLSLTYWNVKYTGQVDSYLGDLAILSREAQFAGTGVILRGADAAARIRELLASGITVARGVLPANPVLFIDGRTQNLGRSETSGIDLVGSYTLETEKAGIFTLNANATYLTRYLAAITPSGTLIDRRNTVFNPLTFKGRGSLNWLYDGVNTRLTVNHVGGYDNNTLPNNGVQKVDSYTTFDLGVTFNIGDAEPQGFFDGGFSLSFDALNLFDRKPPFLDFAPTVNGSGGYDATAANPVGREVAVTLRKRF
ncbi:TonB-dependent receptor [Sphingomonas metalli]|uniref:TonB-dependent receptor n=1 Tax=Sphingomonas metalli TaxID=1779358 RepID=A0A916WS28_9SPHN|nr:TonB-dependent receptor [Sphingomonas metalli]GGB27379.1 TonB-dependent receptor [Sphingomonas metalli]